MTPFQEKVFELLCEIDDICRRHDITYYLYAGSVIGAVRHKGVIPWDDDIDIVMTRSNFEKFKSVVENKMPPGRELVTFEKYPEHRFVFPIYKNVETSTFYESVVFADWPQGVFLDIILLDPVKNEPSKLNRHMENLMVLQELHNTYYVDFKTVSVFKYFYYKFLSDVFGRKKIIDHLRHTLETGNEDTCDGYVARASRFTIYLDKKFVGKPDTVEMYGRKFPTMTGIYEYLRFAYGDSWMHFPPDWDQKAHNNLFDLDYPNRVFENDYLAYVDKEKNNKIWQCHKPWTILSLNLGYDSAHKADLQRVALLRKLQVMDKIKDIDIVDWYNKGRIAELQELLSDYLEWQFAEDLIKDNIVIPVSEEVLYVAGMIWVLDSMYYKADALLQMNDCYKEEKWYQKLADAVEASRALSVAFYEEHENWDHIKELVDEYLPKYPHHVDFIVARCKLLLRSTFQNTGRHTKQHLRNLKKRLLVASQNTYVLDVVLRICREELKYHDKNPYLFDVMADAFVKSGDMRNGEIYYKKAYQLTDDGMLMHKIHSKLAKIGIDADLSSTENSDDSAPDNSEVRYQEQVRKVQAGLLVLLQEFDEICKKENIPYFVGGFLAAEAVELGTFAPECCSGYVVMHPADRKRLIKAVKKHAKPDRTLDSFESYSGYADFSMRYCDTNTTLFDIRTGEFYKYHASNLTVYFVRPDEKSLWRDKLSSLFHYAVVTNAVPRFQYAQGRKVFAGLFGLFMFGLLGKKNAKRLAWNIIYHPGNKNRLIKGSIKSYWYPKRLPIPLTDFDQFQERSLDGVTVRIPINYAAFNSRQIWPKWNNGKPVGKLLKLPVISAMEVSCMDFAEELKKLGRKGRYAAIPIYRLTDAFAYRKWGYVVNSWYVALRSIDRIQMWKKYMPLKARIIALYKARNYNELYKILEEYITVLRQNINRGMAVYFDAEIFRITWDVLDKRGEGALMRRVLPRIPEEHLKPITLPLPKNGVNKKNEKSNRTR